MEDNSVADLTDESDVLEILLENESCNILRHHFDVHKL